MTLEGVDLGDFLAKTLMPAHQQVQDRCQTIDHWAGDERPGMLKPKVPKLATAEYRQLADLSSTPWGDLIVSSLVQMLYVEGYRRPDGKSQPGWDAWQTNGMDARQIPLHFDVCKYGIAYATVLPSAPGSKVPVIRPKSPKRMTAFYDDPVDDEWPRVAMELMPLRSGFRCRLYDERFVWVMELDSNGRLRSSVTRVEHGQEHVPVVRYVNRLDLVGNATGEVEPFITMFHRIDQTIFDRLVVQRFASWVTRTISGMAPPDGVPQENVELNSEQSDALEAAKVKAGADSVLISDDPNTKFGSLPASELAPFIEAKNSDVRDLAAVSQTARTALMGVEANIGAEALASDEKAQSRKKVQRQHTLGESHEQTLALSERIMGSQNDPAAQVVWLDTEPAALPATADALVKLREMGLPMRALLERIPGATQQDVDGWLLELEQEGAGGSSGIDADELKAKLDALGSAIRAGADPQSAANLLGLSLTFTGAIPVSLRLPKEDAATLEDTSAATGG